MQDRPPWGRHYYVHTVPMGRLYHEMKGKERPELKLSLLRYKPPLLLRA